MYSTGMAYLLWLVSGFGALGLHRFYLGKFGTGLLWMFSGGLFGVGGVIDFFLIPSMVREANLGLAYRRALFPDEFEAGEGSRRVRNVTPGRFRSEGGKESLEHTILRLAKRNRGPVTPSEVALESSVSMDEAKKYLDRLVEEGFAQLRVRSSGQLVYFFADFASGASEDDTEGYVDL